MTPDLPEQLRQLVLDLVRSPAADLPMLPLAVLTTVRTSPVAPTVRKLALEIGTSQRAIGAAVRHLVRLGLVETVEIPGVPMPVVVARRTG